MKKQQIQVGGHYLARISGQIVTVRVDTIRETFDARDRAGTAYDVTNLRTGRTTTFRSAAKFRGPAKPPAPIAAKPPTPPIESPSPDTRPLEPGEARELMGSEIAVAESKRAEANPLAAIAARLAPAPAADAAPHIEVSALAGTGKTTTAVEGMARIKGLATAIEPSPQQSAVWNAMAAGKGDSIRFCAFGNAIADALKVKLATRGLDKRGCEASTLHSLGFAAFRQAFGYRKPNKWAVVGVIERLLGVDSREYKRNPGGATILRAVDDLVSLCKQNLTDPTPEALDALTSRFDVETNGQRDTIYDLVPRVLDACKTPGAEITFDDMVWLPVVLNLPVAKADVCIVDESQDLNRMQQALAYAAGHRIVFIGDRNQAIFGFAGADAESMDRMGRELGASTRGIARFPLTVTRRCGKAIVAEARRYVPEFEAHPNNPEGRVLEAKYPVQGSGVTTKELPWAEHYGPLVAPGDMVLCRTNAPMVKECFRFLKRGLKANILGRNIAQGLIALIEKMNATTTAQLIGKLSDWLAGEIAKETAKKFPCESKLEALNDKHDCLLVFAADARTPADVVGKINAVFTDDPKSPGVMFSSIHKAKGLEADHVFFLQPPGRGMRKDKMQEWELQQEDNLRYVAITRAIHSLTYVR